MNRLSNLIIAGIKAVGAVLLLIGAAGFVGGVIGFSVGIASRVFNIITKP